jgi:predicted dehydrogenase
MSRTAVVVAGLGAVAAAHLDAYAELDVEVLGGVDPSPEACDRAAARWGLPCWPALGEALDATRPDVVCITSTARSHAALLQEAARRGIDVLCEKPLAPTAAQGRAMVELAATSGIRLAYGSSCRWLPAVAAARGLVASGAIGDVRVITERLVGGRGPQAQEDMGPGHYPPGSPGGSAMGLVDHGIHFLDVAPWVAGSRVTRAWGRVNRSGGHLGPELAVLELDGGAIAHLVLDDGTWSSAVPQEGLWSDGASWVLGQGFAGPGAWLSDPVEYHVSGTAGALRIALYANQLTLHDATGVRRVALAGRPSPRHFATQLEAFLHARRRGLAPPVPGEVGVRALEVLEQVAA